MSSTRKISLSRHPVPAPGKDLLTSLCGRVMSLDVAFEDVRDGIEMQAHIECESGRPQRVLDQLGRLCTFLEGLKSKNDEIPRDLADVYLLIGDLCREFGSAPQSVDWYQKAIVVDDAYATAYQYLAASLIEMGELHKAIRCLEQEIQLAPGNLSSYLTLADLYDSVGEPGKMEHCIEELLQKDPDNVHALDRLIRHHALEHPEVEIGFLRRRLVSVGRPLAGTELAIWVLHMGHERRFDEALRAICECESGRFEPIYSLLAAHIQAELGRNDSMRRELARFLKAVGPQQIVRERAIGEFAKVFGTAAAQRLSDGMAAAKRVLGPSETP